MAIFRFAAFHIFSILLLCFALSTAAYAQEIETAPPAAAANTAGASLAKKNADSDPGKISTDLKKNCDRQFPGMIQGELRLACSVVGVTYQRFGRSGSRVKCRLSYGEEPREVMACLIGVQIQGELEAGKDDFKKRLQLCSEQYPAHTEIDVFLQESCLIGIYMPVLLNDTEPTLTSQNKTDEKTGEKVSEKIPEKAVEKSAEKVRALSCSEISLERSFIGPCGVGLSLAQDLNSPVQPNKQNQLCEQYFDHKQFHSGYRACLNGRSAGQNPKADLNEVLRGCSEVSDANDTERAACFVGASIYRHLLNKEDVDARFQKCGAIKVSYDEKDVLPCLTAASALDYSSRSAAETACKEIFKTGKGSGRGNCLTSLNLF